MTYREKESRQNIANAISDFNTSVQARKQAQKEEAARERKAAIRKQVKAQRLKKIVAKTISNYFERIREKKPKTLKQKLIARLEARGQQSPKLDLEITLVTSSEEGEIDILEVKTEENVAEVGDEVKLNGKTAPDGDYTDIYGDVYSVENGKITKIKEADPEMSSAKKRLMMRLERKSMGVATSKPKVRIRSDDPVADKVLARLHTKQEQGRRIRNQKRKR